MAPLKQLTGATVYWPGIDVVIEMVSGRWDSCGEHKNNQPSWILLEMPWSFIHVDHAAMNWLVITDTFSRYPCINPLASTSTRAILELLIEDFAHVGYPCTGHE